MNKDLKTQISEILVKWGMPTRQVAINDILALISKIEQEAREDENKECREILIKNTLKSKGESKK